MYDCNSNATHSVGRSGLRSLVAVYIAKHRPGALREKTFFESMPSLELAIYHAAFALDDREPPMRYSHQRRIRMRPMKQAHHFLLQSRDRLAKVRSYEELHDFLRIAFSGIQGLGALYTYDTALRLGFFLKFAPKNVYLHAGTRQGARALGVRNSDVVEVSDLPKELAALPPHEIENFLCIFKPRVHALGAG
jgi:hypothetical protein